MLPESKSKLIEWLSIASAIAGIVGVIGNAVYLFINLRASEAHEFVSVIIVLGISTSLLLLSVIFLFFYYSHRLKELGNLPINYLKVESQLIRQDIIQKNTSDYLHNIFHFYRNILNKVSVPVSEIKTYSNDDITKLFTEIERFLTTLTSNIQSYFTLLTSDNCAVTIKIISGNKIKTLFRDPVSYRSRKRSDFNLDGSMKIYDYKDNTAFHVILSEDHKDTTFFQDNLTALNDTYKNTNPNWKELYNATAVVPICIKDENDKQIIHALLCVDNFAGGLNIQSVKDILCAISDPLYLFFVKLESLATISNEKKIKNEITKRYTNWD